MSLTKAVLDAAFDAIILLLIMLLVDWLSGRIQSPTYYAVAAIAVLLAMTLKNVLKRQEQSDSV